MGVHRRPCDGAEGGLRGLGHVGLGVGEQAEEDGDGGPVADLGQRADGGDAGRHLALSCEGEERGERRGVAAHAEGQRHEDLLVGGELGELVGDGPGDLGAGHLHRRACGGADEDVVPAADGFDEERDAGLAAGECGAAECGGVDLAGDVLDGAEAVVDGGGGVGLACGGECLGAAEDSLAEVRAVACGGPGEGGLDGGGCGGGADVAESARRALRHLGVGVSEQPGERADGLGVAADADGADDADEELALELAERVAERVASRGVGAGLEGVAGHVCELLVAQQRGEGGHGVLAGAAGEQAARVGLRLAVGVRLQDCEELRLPRLAGGLAGMGGRLHGGGEEERGEEDRDA